MRTWSGRKTKQVTRLLSIMAAEIGKLTAGDIEGEIFCYQAMFPEGYHQEYSDPLLAYKAVSDPDTLYYHEAMKQSDRAEFKMGMKKEIQDQFDNGNFVVIQTQVSSSASSDVANATKTRREDRKNKEV